MKIHEIANVKLDNGFEIHVGSKYKKGLYGLEGFGHLIVTWWANQVDDEELRDVVSVEKPYKNGPNEVGVFATRSPVRPNPICISIVDILNIDYDNGIITTSWIDAENNTPVIDLKAYFPCADITREPKTPGWAEDLPKCIEDSGHYDWSNFFNF